MDEYTFYQSVKSVLYVFHCSLTMTKDSSTQASIDASIEFLFGGNPPDVYTLMSSTAYPLPDSCDEFHLGDVNCDTLMCFINSVGDDAGPGAYDVVLDAIGIKVCTNMTIELVFFVL